jgi:superfamily II DNA or RNA helicase
MSTLPQTTSFTPRKGQQDLIEYLHEAKSGDQLSIQWPTGYGKSIGMALAWKHLQASNICERMLVVVANDVQRKQFFADFTGDCDLVSAPCPGGVWQFERAGIDLKQLSLGKKIFVTSVNQVHASVYGGGANTIKDLMTMGGGSWFIAFDEYHHYGEDMPWGKSAKALMDYASYVLATSATPYRRGSDTIFVKPQLVVSYKDAVVERAVKPMLCRTFDYTVTVITQNDQPIEYTTSDLLRIAPEGLDRYQERRAIRFSPQYVHPLIINSIDSLTKKRAQHPGKKLQMIIRAMGCGHAKLVCEQVKIFAEGNGLTIDWIGTGEYGRPDAENEAILRKFCPHKANGSRPDPSLDILVQVGMASEGFDSINVCEIVDLFPVSANAENGKASQDKQFYGRGSRVIKGAIDIPLHVNVPTDHPLERWKGGELHDWMDSDGREVNPPENAPTPPEFDPYDWPDAPTKQRDIELTEVSSDDSFFFTFAERATKAEQMPSYEECTQAQKDKIRGWYINIANQEKASQSEQAEIKQLDEYIKMGRSRLTGIIMRNRQSFTKADRSKAAQDANKIIAERFGYKEDLVTVDDFRRVAEGLAKLIPSLKPIK